MHGALADMSRLLNRLFGGEPGYTLCRRWAVRWGPYCKICKLIGWLLREPHHCRDEMTVREVIEWLRRNP